MAKAWLHLRIPAPPRPSLETLATIPKISTSKLNAPSPPLMTSITQRLLHLRPVLRQQHLYTRRHFSSSSDSVTPSHIAPPKPESEPKRKPSFSSYFNEVRATLQREPPSQNRPQPPRKPLSFSNSPQTPSTSKSASFEKIRRNLAEYRNLSAAPPPSSTASQYVSLEEIYKRNVIAKDNESSTSSNNSVVKPPSGRSFDAIRESLFNSRSNSKNQSDQMSVSRLRESLNLKPGQNADPGSSRILGGSDGLPSFFGKEKNAGGGGGGGGGGGSKMRTGLLRMYGYSDLGAKLKILRPEKKKGKWFSLQELNERLAKLREMEEKESQGIVAGVSWKDLRETMVNLAHSEEEKTKKKTMQRLDILGQPGGTPNYLLSDPRDHLVEKYFHPGNMSSAEKLKLDLKKVRDEFKMSESDCGSARVQVAQLTTKINHLASVLHKKDKHSRRGILAMVQRRKKLLKYLRRTDWDSYCLVLSKLGLRDSPDIKS